MDRLALPALGAVLTGLSGLHLMSGTSFVPPSAVWEALARYDSTNYQHVVIVLQRLTRLVVALYCGAALALSGHLLQRILQNPLVSPSTLGISSGASAFAVLGILLFGLSGAQLLWPALLGGVAAVALSFLTARAMGSEMERSLNLVLAGSMMSILFSSLTAFVVSLDPAAFDNLLNWLVGTIGNFDYLDLPAMAALGAVAMAAAVVLSRSVDLFLLGEEQASTMGVNVTAIFWATFVTAVVLAVTAVVVVGPIGFVGLVVPHIARLLLGEHGRRSLWGCLLLGPIVLVVADIGARTLLAPRVLNVGTVMGLLGGAAFLALILAGTRRSLA